MEIHYKIDIVKLDKARDLDMKNNFCGLKDLSVFCFSLKRN